MATLDECPRPDDPEACGIVAQAIPKCRGVVNDLKEGEECEADGSYGTASYDHDVPNCCVANPLASGSARDSGYELYRRMDDPP